MEKDFKEFEKIIRDKVKSVFAMHKHMQTKVTYEELLVEAFKEYHEWLNKKD